jgi:hypothetical protein
MRGVFAVLVASLAVLCVLYVLVSEDRDRPNGSGLIQQEKTHPSVASRSNDFKGSKAPTSPTAIGFAQKLIQGFRKLSFSRLSGD